MVARRRGAIVNVSSGFAAFPLGLMTVYAATKNYVNHITMALQQVRCHSYHYQYADADQHTCVLRRPLDALGGVAEKLDYNCTALATGAFVSFILGTGRMASTFLTRHPPNLAGDGSGRLLDGVVFRAEGERPSPSQSCA